MEKIPQESWSASLAVAVHETGTGQPKVDSFILAGIHGEVMVSLTKDGRSLFVMLDNAAFAQLVASFHGEVPLAASTDATVPGTMQ